MSMDSEIIGKFVTQQVAVAMAEKSREYENKIKNLRKVEKTMRRESQHAKTIQGAVDAPQEEKSHPRLNRPPSLVLLRNLLLGRPHADRAYSKALREENPNKQALPTEVRQKKGKEQKQRAPRAHRGRHCGPQKPTAPNRAVGQRKGEGKLQLPSKQAPVNKTKRARYPYHHGKVVFFLPSN